MNDVIIVKKDVKNINIRVKPNGEVILTAPQETQADHIEHILNKRSGWIDKKLAFYKKYEVCDTKEYVSGEDFKFLGKSYRLKVIQSSEEFVKLRGGYLNICVRNKDNLSRKINLVKRWYMDKAKSHFATILRKFQSIVNKDIKVVRIRQMKTRWGSCNPRKSYINLNGNLIKAPKQCIEYVIFHELAHLIHPNHDKHFYNYLYTHMPNWRRIKERLENEVAVNIVY